jgi:hypothetical protein
MKNIFDLIKRSSSLSLVCEQVKKDCYFSYFLSFEEIGTIGKFIDGERKLLGKSNLKYIYYSQYFGHFSYPEMANMEILIKNTSIFFCEI